MGLFLFLLMISSVSALIECNQKDVTFENNSIYCFYTPNSDTILMPNLETSSGLSTKIIDGIKNTEAGMRYSIKIEIDILRSKQGSHYFILSQGNESKKINFNILKNLTPAGYEINYLDDYALIILTIPNEDITNKTAIIRFENVPTGYNSNFRDKQIVLLSNTVNEIKLKLYYVNPETGTLNISVSSKDQKNSFVIPLYKQNAPAVTKGWGVTPLFILGNTKVALIVDLILFLVAIVLFTMFIGRLGKVIVKK